MYCENPIVTKNVLYLQSYHKVKVSKMVKVNDFLSYLSLLALNFYGTYSKLKMSGMHYCC